MQPVSLMDLFATAVAAAAAASPAAAATLRAHDSSAAIDGKDLRSVLASAEAPSEHADGLFLWRGDRVMAVRVGAYKVRA